MFNRKNRISQYRLEQIPDGDYIFTITDNVLEPKDWNAYEVTVKGDRVIWGGILQNGVYFDTRTFIGSSSKLLEVLKRDPTGEHPEISYDLERVDVPA